MEKPKIKAADRFKSLYNLNSFNSDFGKKVGKEVIYLLATKSQPSLEGGEWEEIFANSINATWKPSNIGLDDVVYDKCAWGAKTVKSTDPANQKIIRLISGRNSPAYSYGKTEIINTDPNEMGDQVLSIWNERVESLLKKYNEIRTVVLIKSEELDELVIFEFKTTAYVCSDYNWIWNKRGNLEGICKNEGTHCFTWQPHGSQFTIIEKVPKNNLLIKIKIPRKINKNDILNAIGYTDSWVQVKKRTA